MKTRSSPAHCLTAAQRGQIVQQVIVDRRSIADAAAGAGLPERLVRTWVADYRRYGMSSLRHRPCQSLAAELIQFRLAQPLRLVLRGAAAGMRWLFALDSDAPPPSPIRRSQDDGRGAS